MKRLIIILSILFLACGCSNAKTEVEKLMEDNEYIIVDVRTKEEYEELHVVDSINIPLDKIDEDIELDKDKLIFVYCRSGNRSSKALKTLTDLGYKVYNLGGINEIDLEKE